MLESSTKRFPPTFVVRRLLTPLWWRIAKLALVLLFGLAGYRLAPADLTPGEYTVSITVTHAGTTFTVPYLFQLGTEEGGITQHQIQLGDYSAIVEGQDAISYRLGKQIVYRVRLLDSTGRAVSIPLHAISSIIRGPNYEQTVPATVSLDEWSSFSMRMPFKAKVTTGLLLAVAVLWLTELVPLAATALLIPVVAVVAGVTDAQTVMAPFANPLIALFLAGFLLAEAMRRTEIDRRVALLILNHASHNPIFLMLTLMSITAFLSMWMSNTASVALMIPIALAIIAKMPTDGTQGYPRALLLAIAYAATIGGVGSAIGTPANMLAMTFLNEYAGGTFTFAHWFGYGVPFLLIMLPIIWLYLLLSFRVHPRQMTSSADVAGYADDLAKMGPLHGQQNLVLGVFVVIMGLWLTEGWHGIPPAIVAMAGVFALFFFNLIKQEDLNRINWNALLTFGGGLAIGTLLVSTGVSDWVALHLIGMTALPIYIVFLLVTGLTVLLGAFISNTACAAMLIPLAIPLAQILNLDPRLLVTLIAIASSIDFALVTGTPPTMMVYSTGMFKVSEIFRRGILVDLAGVLVLSFAVIWIWRWLGIVTF